MGKYMILNIKSIICYIRNYVTDIFCSCSKLEAWKGAM